MLKDWIRNVRTFLHYNRQERMGLTVFAFFIVLLYATFYAYETHFSESNTDNEAFLAMVDSLTASVVDDSAQKDFFAFNPNTVDSTSLSKLGFAVRNIKTFLKYRGTGATFRKKEDLKKLYFMTDSLYEILEPFVEIPSEKQPVRKEKMGGRKVVDAEKKKVEKPLHCFDFDPNTLSSKGWDSLGIPARVSKRIINYRGKGGVFKKVEDLQKIYGLTEEMYERLAPYVKILQPKQKVKTAQKKYDLNSITEEELQQLNVSSRVRKMLIGYRKKLGGFVSVQQLKELYNITERDWELLKSSTAVVTPAKTLDINTATVKDLVSHPYIEYAEAKAIVRYRERKGFYESLEDLLQRKILSKSKFEKVHLYLIAKKRK